MPFKWNAVCVKHQKNNYCDYYGIRKLLNYVLYKIGIVYIRFIKLLKYKKDDEKKYTCYNL